MDKTIATKLGESREMTEKLYERLRKARQSRKQTVAEAAREIGTSWATFHAWETGTTPKQGLYMEAVKRFIEKAAHGVEGENHESA